MKRLRREDGFTLIEMLVVIIFLGVLFGAFSMVLSSTMSTSTEITNQSVMQAQARAGVDELVRDLRQAFNGDPAGSSPIESMSASSIVFDSPDRQTPFHLRRISYQLSGTNLQRKVDTSTNNYSTGWPWTFPGLGTWVTRIGSVQNTDIFTYYDNSNPPNVVTTPASVASVLVKVVVGDAQGNGRQYTYSESATLRDT